MLDSLFGSHYIQSAINLAVQAIKIKTIKSNETHNLIEAERLFELAILEMKAGITEIQENKQSIPKHQELINKAHKNIATWKNSIKKLKRRHHHQ